MAHTDITVLEYIHESYNVTTYVGAKHTPACEICYDLQDAELVRRLNAPPRFDRATEGALAGFREWLVNRLHDWPHKRQLVHVRARDTYHLGAMLPDGGICRNCKAPGSMP